MLLDYILFLSQKNTEKQRQQRLQCKKFKNQKKIFWNKNIFKMIINSSVLFSLPEEPAG